MSDAPEVLLVDIEGAGRMLSLGRSKIYSLLAQGRLSSIKIGRARRLLVSELCRFVETELAEDLANQEGDQI